MYRRPAKKHLSRFRPVLRWPAQPIIPTHVIFRWQPSYHPNHVGLGDTLRGIIHTRQICMRLQISFDLDMSQHEISHYLNFECSEWARNTPVPKIFRLINHDVNSLSSDAFIKMARGYVHTTESRRVLVVYTNQVPSQPLTLSDCVFLRDLLSVKPEWQVSYPRPYTLFHLRFPDKHFHSMPSLNRKFMPWLKRHIKDGDIVCSNSEAVKDFMKHEFPNVHIDQPDERFGTAAHFADAHISKNQVATIVRDLQRITNASKIMSYCTYGWTSNFVLWPAKAFEIPVYSQTHG